MPSSNIWDDADAMEQAGLVRCPFCKSGEWVRKGFDVKGKRRWLCKSCRRSYGPAQVCAAAADPFSERTIGDCLRALRAVNGMVRQSEVAEAIGVSGQTYSKWERNVLAPNKRHLAALEGYFGLDEGALTVNMTASRAYTRRHAELLGLFDSMGPDMQEAVLNSVRRLAEAAADLNAPLGAFHPEHGSRAERTWHAPNPEPGKSPTPHLVKPGSRPNRPAWDVGAEDPTGPLPRID